MKFMHTLTILLMLLSSCEHDVITDDYKPKYTSKQLLDRLEKYYSESSIDSFNKFLNEWHRIVPPANRNLIYQDDTIQNIYQVITELYKPFEFGSYKADNYFSGKNEYIIIQSEINYAVVSNKDFKFFINSASGGYPNDTVYGNLRTKRLLNFRPKLALDSIKYLYLTNEYRQAIIDFLGTEHQELGEGDIMNTAYPKNETEKKYNFLCPILPIVYGHWGGYWHIETFPIIDKIVFDNTFEHALIDFRSSVGQTVIQYKISKTSGHWKSDKNAIISIQQE